METIRCALAGNARTARLRIQRSFHFKEKAA
jgi:hypothetical protein